MFSIGTIWNFDGHFLYYIQIKMLIYYFMTIRPIGFRIKDFSLKKYPKDRSFYSCKEYSNNWKRASFL